MRQYLWRLAYIIKKIPAQLVFLWTQSRDGWNRKKRLRGLSKSPRL